MNTPPHDNDVRTRSRVTSGRGGYTMVEMMAVVVIMGIMVAVAAPRIDMAPFRVDSEVQQMGSTLLSVQRAAVTRQHSMVVSFDEAQRRMRVHYDLNSNGVINAGENSYFEPMETGVVFGRGAAPQLHIGGGPITFTFRQGGLPAVVFHRNGTVNEEGGFYLNSAKGRAADARAVVIDRGTGRPSWYNYSGTAWTQSF